MKILKIVDNVKRFIFNITTKRKVIKLAKLSGCDMDGDIVSTNGKTYFVHIFNDIVEEVTNEQNQEVSG